MVTISARIIIGGLVICSIILIGKLNKGVVMLKNKFSTPQLIYCIINWQGKPKTAPFIFLSINTHFATMLFNYFI